MSNDAMVKAFWKQAGEAISAVESATFSEVTVGPELEYFLCRAWGGAIATHDEKDAVLALLQQQYPEQYSPELGAACIEHHPGPVALTSDGFEGLLAVVNAGYNALWHAAAEHNLYVKGHGTIPWIPTTNVPRTPATRYQVIPDYYAANRAPWNMSPEIGGVTLQDPGVVGLLNAFQISIQAADIAHGVDLLNRMFYLSPLAVALSANALMLGNRSTGYSDCRFEVWRRTFDTRTPSEVALGCIPRIGLPANYFQNVYDYLADAARYPFILDDVDSALRIGIGAYWRDARLKFVNGKVVVEFRPVSMQKNPKENVAIACFVIGRLLWSVANEENLLPMNLVLLNKTQAEIKGLNALLHTNTGLFPARNILHEDLDKAESGLRLFGIYDDLAKRLLDELRQKLSS